MEFKGNNYNGEDQIRKLLLERQKLTDKTVDDTLRRKCEDRLFTRREMRMSEIKDRAATEISWQWHHPKALDALLSNCVEKDLWRVHGEYVEKGPFAKAPTSVTVSQKAENDVTGEVTIRLMPKFGDEIFYEVGAEATTSSLEVKDPNNFATSELKVSFLCIDSTGEHPTGEATLWVREITVRYKIIDTSDGQRLRLETQHGVKIKYTTDGSDPKENGGVYDGEFIIPANTVYVQAVAVYDGGYFAPLSIRIPNVNGNGNGPSKGTGLKIDKTRPLFVRHYFKAKDTKESYDNIETFKKYADTVCDVRLVLFKLDDRGKDSGYIELNIDTKISTTPDMVEKAIENLKEAFIIDGRANIELECGSVLFKTGQAFYDFLNEREISLSEFKQEELVGK